MKFHNQTLMYISRGVPGKKIFFLSLLDFHSYVSTLRGVVGKNNNLPDLFPLVKFHDYVSISRVFQKSTFVYQLPWVSAVTCSLVKVS